MMDNTKTKEITSLDALLQRNAYLAEQFHRNDLMLLIHSDEMSDQQVRARLLDAIQTFSDYFQKVVMLRNAFCENPKFMSVTQAHLSEEFEHNMQLMHDRNNRPRAWDPILESGSAWFAWKMLMLDNEEKTLLVHLVLETSANIFFQAAHQVMRNYGETDYFQIHSEADDDHQRMGVELLQQLSSEKYTHMVEVQDQGWRILNMVCEQMASIARG